MVGVDPSGTHPVVKPERVEVPLASQIEGRGKGIQGDEPELSIGLGEVACRKELAGSGRWTVSSVAHAEPVGRGVEAPNRGRAWRPLPFVRVGNIDPPEGATGGRQVQPCGPFRGERCQDCSAEARIRRSTVSTCPALKRSARLRPPRSSREARISESAVSGLEFSSERAAKTTRSPARVSPRRRSNCQAG